MRQTTLPSICEHSSSALIQRSSRFQGELRNQKQQNNASRWQRPNMNKRGQLTIFIIIGIVLLFSAALIIYIRQSVVEYKPPVEIALEQVPTELRPLQTFVVECLELTMKEAIRLAGMQGGYVDAAKIAVNERDPTEGEGIVMSPGSSIRIPYWYYMKSPNTCDNQCEFTTKQPSLYRGTGVGNSVEEQVDKYVEEKLASCLANFNQFRQQGFEIQQTQLKAVTTIAKTDMFVQLDYPLTVTKDGRVEQMSRFVARVSVNLGKFYDLATELTQKEIRTSFLDFMAINLIDSYSGIDENKLPPLADTTFGGGAFKHWLQRDVKSKIEEILMIYTPALQATGTLNYQGNYYEGDSQLAEGLYSLFILPLNKTHDANAEFNYLAWWPTYVKITPSEGELIRPNSAENFHWILSTFGVKQYKFAYDVSFPVLIILSDPDALGGEGFIFQFALEANIRNNAQMKPTTQLLSTSGRPSQTLVCNPGNFNSGDITVNVVDSITKTGVDQALVYFIFGKESCLIGETAVAKGIGTMISKMPVGIGSLIVSKDGYMSKVVPFGTSLDTKKEIDIELDPFVEVNLSVARVPVYNFKYTSVDAYKVGQHAGLYGPPGSGPHEEKTDPAIKVEDNWLPVKDPIPDLEVQQQAIVSLVRIQDNPAEDTVIAAANILGSGERTKTVRLVPGRYQVSGTLLDNQRTVVPRDMVCTAKDFLTTLCSSIFSGACDECHEIPPIPFDIFPKGGIALDNFTIEPESLKDAKEIVIYLFSLPDGYTRDANGVTNLKHKDLEQMGKVEEYSEDYFELIKPTFKK